MEDPRNFKNVGKFYYGKRFGYQYAFSATHSEKLQPNNCSMQVKQYQENENSVRELSRSELNRSRNSTLPVNRVDCRVVARNLIGGRGIM